MALDEAAEREQVAEQPDLDDRIWDVLGEYGLVEGEQAHQLHADLVKAAQPVPAEPEPELPELPE